MSVTFGCHPYWTCLCSRLAVGSQGEACGDKPAAPRQQIGQPAEAELRPSEAVLRVGTGVMEKGAHKC